jgi:hypothetical protein
VRSRGATHEPDLPEADEGRDSPENGHWFVGLSDIVEMTVPPRGVPHSHA